MMRDSKPTPHRIELDRAEALRLLSSVSLGRIVFTLQALPTVRPVAHVMDGGDIVIRTREGAALASPAQEGDGTGVVVAYEADAIDPDTHLGWSVVVTGYARLVTDPHELARVRSLLRPWAPQQGLDQAVRIHPELVTGVMLIHMLTQAGEAREHDQQTGRGRG
ncbi:pyridoxamine 5'-phosphate oxidase [Streptomyces sp. IMTB 2501]|uniref:pyridoxamine 5'-phosphate oxidase family protein n=1 Tax=Streptomyces sp. IMTB 2501 TaxID=1776340 RepID=UPI00096D056E|nr:pyridoxamine 5'-phosphate oxidase family protein [Streptomyces sp. IMTB 2501]OLZ65294.1 pyridoxamine 5'-phosphate oxidase [Streptomyces sp. IMTB 2501]